MLAIYFLLGIVLTTSKMICGQYTASICGNESDIAQSSLEKLANLFEVFSLDVETTSIIWPILQNTFIETLSIVDQYIKCCKKAPANRCQRRPKFLELADKFLASAKVSYNLLWIPTKDYGHLMNKLFDCIKLNVDDRDLVGYVEAKMKLARNE